MPDLEMERSLGWPGSTIAGVDEVGRGPLAGPVVAAAVILPIKLPDAIHCQVKDSKQVKAEERTRLANLLQATDGICWALGVASVSEIEDVNILRATELAMCRAVEALERRPEHALIDGNRVPHALPCPGTAVVKGDGLCLSIAAASILAKTTRDALMSALAQEHPGYGWERNAGYGTAEHRAAIARLGVTPHHRRSFGTVRQKLSLTS